MLEPSMLMHARRWGWTELDYTGEIAKLRQWIEKRSFFMKDYMENMENYRELNFHFSWGNIKYAVKQGEKLEFLPLNEFGEIDKERDGYGSVLKWINETGEILECGDGIEKNSDYYACYKEYITPKN